MDAEVGRRLGRCPSTSLSQYFYCYQLRGSLDD